MNLPFIETILKILKFMLNDLLIMIKYFLKWFCISNFLSDLFRFLGYKVRTSVLSGKQFLKELMIKPSYTNQSFVVAPPDEVEEIDANIRYLKDKNDFLKVLIREQSVANNAVAIPQTFTDKPEFCKESCKSCNCESYFSIEEIQNTAKIGKFFVKI